MSAGFIVEEAECSICGNDPEDCEHITGRRYGDEVCVRVITKADLFDVSIVSRPNQPDARILRMSITRADLEAGSGFLVQVRDASVLRPVSRGVRWHGGLAVSAFVTAVRGRHEP